MQHKYTNTNAKNYLGDFIYICEGCSMKTTKILDTECVPNSYAKARLKRVIKGVDANLFFRIKEDGKSNN